MSDLNTRRRKWERRHPMLIKRLRFAWIYRTWPWRLLPGWRYISLEKPSPALMEHARRRAIAENWKDIEP